jgi:hypothetical protein
MGHHLTRKELYDLVWSEPMTKLAERFGISSVALAKNCRKMQIPVPPRGYWARKAAGRSVIAIRLPLAAAGLRRPDSHRRRPMWLLLQRAVP